MKAIVLAAGKSTRMGCNENKCIMPLDDEGHTMLGRVLDQLKALSVWPVVVVGYQARKVVRIAKRHHTEVLFVHNIDYRITGSLYSIWLASRAMDLDGQVVMLASGSNLITDKALEAFYMSYRTIANPPNVAVMYPYPHHLEGVRNIYHRLERYNSYGKRAYIAESSPHELHPDWDDYVAYTQFATVCTDKFKNIPNIVNWRTVNSGMLLSGFHVMEIGTEDTLDVNTPHDFELAKEMFGYV